MKTVEEQRPSDIPVRESLTTSLILSTLLHGGFLLCMLGGVWLWGGPTYYKPPAYTVALVDAPLTLKPPPATRASAGPQQPPEPVTRQHTTVPNTHSAPEASSPKKVLQEKTPPATRKAEATPAKQGMQLPASTQAVKRTPTKEAPKPKASPKHTEPKIAAASEAQSAVQRLRKRQAEQEARQQHTVQARQRAAAERVAALRARYGDKVQPGGESAGEDPAAARLQQIRLQSYQAYVREKIIEAWIIPLPPQERHGLQATAFLLVRRDGQVEHIHLVESSKNRLFDESLLQAIRRAAPLPELPKEYPDELLEVEMRFSDRES